MSGPSSRVKPIATRFYNKLQSAEPPQFGRALESQYEPGARATSCPSWEARSLRSRAFARRPNANAFLSPTMRQYAWELPQHRPELHGQCTGILHLDDRGFPGLLQKASSELHLRSPRAKNRIQLGDFREGPALAAHTGEAQFHRSVREQPSMPPAALRCRTCPDRTQRRRR